LNISGDASFSNPSDPSSLQAVNILRQATNLFKDSKASSSIDLPETIAVNFYQDISSNLAIMGGINWTRWERVKNLVIKFDNAAQPDSITNLNYKNSTFSSLGLNYKYTPQLSLKTGIAYDKSPVTNAQDKHLSFDFGYSHLFIDDIEIDSSEAYSTGGYTAGYHRLTGKYSAQVDILSLQLNWIF
jgi:long-chain fatty acid transport protein